MTSLVEQIRNALPDEAAALEALQRRSSDVWEEYRAQLADHPDAIEPPAQAIAEGRVRVAVDTARRPVGFSVVQPVKAGRCELDDLFVEPESMRLGVGRLLVADVASRAARAGAAYVAVIANPNALGFYERIGFEATGEVPTRFGPGVRMSLDLSRRDTGQTSPVRTFHRRHRDCAPVASCFRVRRLVRKVVTR